VPQMRVRMYRQGLGDCFLLSATDADRVAWHVLVDCGVLLGTPDAAATMHEVAADILAVTGGHLDAVVATHEHWDHISGFLQAEDVFTQLTIDTAWLAWTEDEHDELACRLRATRRAALRAVSDAAQDRRPACTV